MSLTWPLEPSVPVTDRLRAGDGRHDRPATAVSSPADPAPVHAANLVDAARLRAAGVEVVVTVSAAGRNRVAVEADLAAAADIGAAVLLDPSDGVDLTASQLHALARYAGLRVAGWEPAGPGAARPPVRTRPVDRTSAPCPKHLAHGPCGGVGPDGGCEVPTGPRQCGFLATPPTAIPPTAMPVTAPTAAPPTAAAIELGRIAERRPLVVSGFPAHPMDSDSVAICAETLRETCDAALAGDSGRARTQFPPSYRALLMARAGVRAWAGVNCRDRGTEALRVELEALRTAGAAAVHCVTGDHPALGDRPDATGVFELEGSTLIPAARASGHLVSFAESPLAPPRPDRPLRAARKAVAGGRFCLLQYAGEPAATAEFVTALAAVAPTPVGVLPGVPLVIDRPGALLLRDFVGSALPAGYLERVLDAADPVRAGIRAAVALGGELLAIDRVAGVVVAGGARRGDEAEYAAALATVCRELGGGS
ncbi:MAG: hypothetical protein QM638_07470 [Nocardioides sp.]|uniref:hypothetical protein n=1 Tax=Nocardioides sp. TaxID=35761 RepID=UPI0039E65898